MLTSLRSAIVPEFAVDLGSAHTQVYLKGKGLVAREASFVALREDGRRSGRVVAVGNQAKALSGRTSQNVRNTRPLLRGRVENIELAETFLRHVLSTAGPRGLVVGPKLLLAMPCGASAIEEDAILRTAAAAGGGQVFAVAEPIAAALGVGLPIEESCGSMIVDIGGGSTTVSVVSLSGIVVSSTCATGGGYLDWLIVEHVRRTKGVLIGESTAEHIKMTLGTAVQHAHVRSMKVQGQNAKTGLPATAEIFESDVVEAFGDCLHEIARLIEEILDRTPPELAADLMDTGAILVGGGALLQDIDLFLSEKTGLPMTLAEDPATATITGCGQILEQWQKYKHLLLDH